MSPYATPNVLFLNSKYQGKNQNQSEVISVLYKQNCLLLVRISVLYKVTFSLKSMEYSCLMIINLTIL